MGELAGAGLALSLVGMAGQTMAARKAADAQAAAAEAEGRSIEEGAAFDERQYRRKAGLVQGKARAMVAASGIDPSSKSPLFLELDNARQAEIEALNIRRTGQIGVAGKRYEAQLAKRAKAGAVLGGLGSFGTILGNYALARRTPNVFTTGGGSGSGGPNLAAAGTYDTGA